MASKQKRARRQCRRGDFQRTIVGPAYIRRTPTQALANTPRKLEPPAYMYEAPGTYVLPGTKRVRLTRRWSARSPPVRDVKPFSV